MNMHLFTERQKGCPHPAPVLKDGLLYAKGLYKLQEEVQLLLQLPEELLQPPLLQVCSHIASEQQSLA